MATKARMFNREAANPRNKPEEILKYLGLKVGQKVADIGAGGGYFSLRLAEIVGQTGKVYAVDVDPGELEFINRMAQEKSLDNIKVLLTKKMELSLPEKVDLMFLRNVYHHLKNRVRYFTNLKQFLESDGRIAIVEHERGRRFNLSRIFEHRVTQAIIIGEMEEAGYNASEKLGFLSDQSFTIFSTSSYRKEI